MKLWTLNKWLRRAGLVLVLSEDLYTGEQDLSLRRKKTYDRATQTKTPLPPFKPWINRLPNFREWMGEPIVLSATQREQILKDAFRGKKR